MNLYKKGLLSVLGLLLLAGVPPVSEATTFTFGGATQTGTGTVTFTGLTDPVTGFRVTGSVAALDSPSLTQLIFSSGLSGAITNPTPISNTIVITFNSFDYASRAFDSSYINNLSASGIFFSDLAGNTPDGTGASFTLTGLASNNTPVGPMMFQGSSTNFSFPPPDAQTTIGPCGSPGVEGECRPFPRVTLTLTLPAGASLQFPNSFDLLQQAPSAVPEPTTALLLLPGLAALALSRRTRLFRKEP